MSNIKEGQKIYILVNEFNMFKIGISNNPELRSRCIETSSGVMNDILLNHYVEDPLKFESDIKRMLQPFNVIGEWYKDPNSSERLLSVMVASATMGVLMALSIHLNECYQFGEVVNLEEICESKKQDYINFVYVINGVDAASLLIDNDVLFENCYTDSDILELSNSVLRIYIGGLPWLYLKETKQEFLVRPASKNSGVIYKAFDTLKEKILNLKSNPDGGSIE